MSKTPDDIFGVETVDELTALFAASMDRLDDTKADARVWLLRQDVPEIAIDTWPGPLGVAKIETLAPGLFDFAEEGRPAYIQPVLVGGEFTPICDLIAWRPDDPAKWWTSYGSGIPLGVAQLDRGELLGEPLAIRRTPLSWLVAGGMGVVVTCWSMTLPILRSVPILIAEDDPHAEELYARFRAGAGRIPEIRVWNQQAAA